MFADAPDRVGELLTIQSKFGTQSPGMELADPDWTHLGRDLRYCVPERQPHRVWEW